MRSAEITRLDAPMRLDAAALDILMPMHAELDAQGVIRHIGPSLARLAGSRQLLGQSVFHVFQMRRPTGMQTLGDMLAQTGRRLHLDFREDRPVRLRGVIVPRPDDVGALLNLALGLGELTDLGGAGLTCTDFSATDMTVDMLYLIEAKSAAMSESRRLIERLNGAKIAAEEQATTDVLTGLSNRRALERDVDRLVAARLPFAICNVDLDFFKAVNDTYGHAAGDHVLQEVAQILTDVTRSTDTVARVGGDEFVILFRELVDPKVIDGIARRLIGRLERPILFNGIVCRISGSLGTSLSTDYLEPKPDQMMEDADLALYASKERGRAQHTVFTFDLRKAADDVAKRA